jgi:predicted Zn-dependent protease
MQRLFRGAALLLVLATVIIACSTVPITGRKQLSLIPASEILSMSYAEYGEFIKASKLSTNSQQTAMIKTVGGRIQKAVESYFQQKGLAESLADYKWEFNLVDNEEANAWCMPGGKVVFYTGILPITKTDAGVAVVMGHEVAHAIAEHGNERMSQQMLAQLGGMVLSEALSKETEKTKALWSSAYGLGAQFGVLLPFSRTQETESDHLGLIFMAMAGYNLNEAVPFWQRMAASKGDGSSVPEFMSTHPSDDTRIANLKQLVPEAMQYYKR